MLLHATDYHFIAGLAYILAVEMSLSSVKSYKQLTGYDASALLLAHDLSRLQRYHTFISGSFGGDDALVTGM